MFYSVKLVSIALLLAVGLDHTHIQPPRRQTLSAKRFATYTDFTKLDKWRFLLARLNRAPSPWPGGGGGAGARGVILPFTRLKNKIKDRSRVSSQAGWFEDPVSLPLEQHMKKYIGRSSILYNGYTFYNQDDITVYSTLAAPHLLLSVHYIYNSHF